MAPTESPSTAPPRANGTTRPYLVFMRIGANALHPQWLQREPDRNWDLFLSCYTPNPPHPEAIATSTGGYNKLTHFRECVQSGQLDLSAYRLVMLADDDLEIVGGSISAFFEHADRLGLTVSHPAQSWAGYWSHRIMLRNPLAEWRETNFVEVMCPCFETGFIAHHLDSLAITYSTWGTDHAYSHLARANGGRVGIIDSAVIRHTKPIQTSGAFYRKLAADGIDPGAELKTILDALPRDYHTHRLIGIHVRPGPLAALRRLAAQIVEKHKRRFMKLMGHRQHCED